MMLMDQN